MIAALSGLISLMLLGLAVLHFVWGLRIWWPAGDEQALARTVVGAPKITAMPARSSCFAVTLALSAIALTALVLGGLVGQSLVPNWLFVFAGWGAAAVLLLRGAMAFTPFWARLTPEEPFRTYDRRLYGPLCLALGLGLVLLLAGQAAP